MLIHIGLESYSPAVLSSIRIVTGSLFLLPLALYYRKTIPAKFWPWIAFSGMLGSFLPSNLYSFAQQEVSSSMAAVLSSFTPFFTLLIARFAYQNNVTNKQWSGIVLGFVGGLSLIFFKNTGDFNTTWKGLYVLLATICYAVNLNILKFKLKSIPPLSIASSTLVVPGIISAAILYFSPDFNLSQSITETENSLYAGIGLGLTATGLAIVLFNLMLKVSTPAFASSITYVIPVVAMFLGLAFLDEKIEGLQYFATAVILVSVYLTKK